MRARFVCCLAVLAAIATPALGDYRSEYKEGIRAVDRKQWSEVAKRMRAAVSDKPASSELILIYGMRQEPYIPYYYLGVALDETGDCMGALAAWQNSEEREGIQSRSEYAELKKRRDKCGNAAALANLVNDAARAIGQADQAANSVDRLRQQKPGAWTNELEGRRTAQQSRLNDLRARLTPARNGQNAEALRAIVADARSVQARFDEMSKSIESWVPPAPPGPRVTPPDVVKPDVPPPPITPGPDQKQPAGPQDARDIERAARDAAAIRDLRDRITTLARRAQSASGRMPRGGTPPIGLQRARSRLDAAVLKGSVVATVDDPARLRAIESDLQSSLLAFETALKTAEAAPAPSRTAVPDALVRAASAYFHGRYQESIEALDRARFDDPAATAYSRLFSAAARFALSRQGGPRSAELRNGASADVRACAALKPALIPDQAEFSPAFVQFFLSQRRQEDGG